MPYSRGRQRSRNSGRDSGRKTENRALRARVLILCEGEKTEPNYFWAICREFNLTNAVVVEGAACDPLTLVQKAKEFESRKYDRVFCVFDRDEFPPDRFDNAIAMCDEKRVHAIWSNEAFELWYVLHFEYLNTAPAGSGGAVRTWYLEKLKEYLVTYEKNDPSMWEHLKDRLDTARRNAINLASIHDAALPNHRRVPMTRVPALIEFLEQQRDFQPTELPLT